MKIFFFYGLMFESPMVLCFNRAYAEPVQKQRELLNGKFEARRGDMEQVDDIWIVGVSQGGIFLSCNQCDDLFDNRTRHL